MTHFQIEIVEGEGADETHTYAKFAGAEFAIANAVFSVMATKPKTVDCTLWCYAEDGKVFAVATRAEFMDALRSQRTEQMMDPGRPPLFRR